MDRPPWAAESTGRQNENFKCTNLLPLTVFNLSRQIGGNAKNEGEFLKVHTFHLG